MIIICQQRRLRHCPLDFRHSPQVLLQGLDVIVSNYLLVDLIVELFLSVDMHKPCVDVFFVGRKLYNEIGGVLWELLLDNLEIWDDRN